MWDLLKKSCLRPKKYLYSLYYTVTSHETYTEPVVLNSFTWCLQIPPRCPRTWTELRQRHRVKTEIKPKITEECCEGYKATRGDGETDASCLPFCEKCVAGVCVAPNECQCDPGYHGDDCTSACPAGTWGSQCTKACNCGENGTCEPINGVCQCSPGLQGPRCEERCAIGQWGPSCTNECACQNRDNECDAVTGGCIDDVSSAEQTSPTLLYPFESSTDRSPQSSGINDMENMENMEITLEPRETIERTNDDWTDDVNYILETTNPPAISIAIPPKDTEILTSEARTKDTSTTARPVIVLVSVPERRRDVEDRPKFATKDALRRQNDGGVSNIDYVKTIQKDAVQASAPISLDITLIVVAAIVSLGLTSLAVVMVLHMRSKLFETIRLAVYDEEKTKEREHEGANSGKTSGVANTTLPSSPIRANPVFAINTEPETILTLDGIESLNTYANGAAMIGLRISGNFRDLLQEGHYDRPSATLIRLHTNSDNSEPLYEEIPLETNPLTGRKDL
ncbi:uncharacterized protein [Cardiocondyla obscurior]|uniref:uncharacterized protein isoform X2 n=1 Tax=Cardiocondyla obscurior TaxID=286306 RepID=UPI0039658338